MKSGIWLGLVFFTLLSVLFAWFYFQSGTEDIDTEIKWTRSGGFIGLNEDLIIQSNGSVSYSSILFGDGNLILTEDELEDILSQVDEALSIGLDSTYFARSGVADYFQYQLTVRKDSETETVQWVDSWAAEKTIPNDLEEVQNNILSLIERIHIDIDPSGNTDQRAEEIARDFIVQAPTFKHDGISDTLEVTDTKALDTFPIQYIITITFDSANAGYGDRTGQAIEDVETPHTAVVTVINDNVVSAILDNQWDELNQKNM
jgi:hypothetical protein